MLKILSNPAKILLVCLSILCLTIAWILIVNYSTPQPTVIVQTVEPKNQLPLPSLNDVPLQPIIEVIQSPVVTQTTTNITDIINNTIDTFNKEKENLPDKAIDITNQASSMFFNILGGGLTKPPVDNPIDNSQDNHQQEPLFEPENEEF